MQVVHRCHLHVLRIVWTIRHMTCKMLRLALLDRMDPAHQWTICLTQQLSSSHSMFLHRLVCASVMFLE